MPIQEEYKVKLEVFEGPLDLLLYLIKKDEVDIYDIPIELITRQYMEYLGLMRMLDLDIAGEFLVMAATLMMIKSRMLLPPEERSELEAEEEDPRWELIRQLIEYKKFKDAAANLQEMESRTGNMFLRSAEDPVVVMEQPGVGLEDVTIFDLIASFNEALKRIQVNEIGEIMAERFTVADGIESILGRIKRETQLVFATLFRPLSTRHEIIITFLALLELIRLRQVVARQEAVFGDIVIMRPETEQRTEDRRQTTDDGRRKTGEANSEDPTPGSAARLSSSLDPEALDGPKSEALRPGESNAQRPMEDQNKI
ncbi:MAG: segregation/condensation protein A [Kiritimatiellaeota bacterium]|nr:segregation/condensation protein A [Kiritimatiellota bacterium]